MPLTEAMEALNIQMVHCLDAAISRQGLTKQERKTIKEMLLDLAGVLAGKLNDDALKAIYDKHSPTRYADDEVEAKEMVKAFMEDMLGIELGDDFDLSDMESPEDLMRQFEGKFKDNWEAQEKNDAARKANRKKSAKQIAQEAKQAAESQEISQSIREVYRKLASALHPDREPDSVERERKNVLMQRANKAYEKRNLLELLQLQLELEHIDQHAINNISQARIKHYNKVLKEQKNELDMEISHVQASFAMRFNVSSFALFPERVVSALEVNIVHHQQFIRELEDDLKVFDGDIAKFKAWLKEIRQQKNHYDRSMELMNDIPF
ncbi:MAG: molecular chaperone DnaJ [Rhodocyclaceae bacterium]|nr:molecular chaperone DnaJ [Rhodocyclaceae bacterium]